MKKRNIIFTLLFFACISCLQKANNEVNSKNTLHYSIDKIINVYRSGDCLTLFQMKISNPSEKNFVFADDAFTKTVNRNGFYLSISHKNSVKTFALKAYPETFFEFSKLDYGYIYLTTSKLQISCFSKDSLAFKELLMNAKIGYHSSGLNLDTLVKTHGKKNKFIQSLLKKEKLFFVNVDTVFPFKLNELKIEYLDNMPINL